jgi:N-acetylmuramoyl-L-alanine amidase
MLPISSVAIIDTPKNARFARVPDLAHSTRSAYFPAAEFPCYPAAVLAAVLAALVLLAQPLPQVDVALDPGHSRADIGSSANGLREYVSLHFNGGPTNLRGTETYFNPERAADAPSADYALASALQRHVVGALADELGYASVDRGVKSDLAAGKPYGHFFSLRGPVPSALVENLFLSNANEAALLRDDGTLDALADGCAQGVLEYFAGAAPAD